MGPQEMEGAQPVMSDLLGFGPLVLGHLVVPARALCPVSGRLGQQLLVVPDNTHHRQQDQKTQSDPPEPACPPLSLGPCCSPELLIQL